MNKLNNMATIAALSIALSTTLVGCGGGGGGSSAPNDTSGPVESFGLLKPVSSDEELGESLKRGLAGSPSQLSIGGPPLPLDEISSVAGEGAANFSTTNIQEEGVEEADITKYDGEFLYVLDRSPQAFDDDFAGLTLSFAGASIRLFETDAEGVEVDQVARIELESQEISISGLYLVEPADTKLLLSIGQTFGQVPWDLFAFDYYWQEGTTKITAWDVEDARNPAKHWTLEFDGSLLTSRRINNTLYVVTRFTPSVEGVIPFPVEQAQIESNQALIDGARLSELLPDVRKNDEESRKLLLGSECYLPNPEFDELSVIYSSGSIVTVTAVDLANPDNMESVCLNTFASGFYMSKDSLYITANTSGDSTFIHKVGLNDGAPDYRGSGEVPGYLGTSNPSFLMSEREGDLRVISSSWANRFFPLPVLEIEDESTSSEEEEDFGVHRLTILREAGDGMRLEQVAKLPNSARPKHIGKPGEDIYAARFLGNRAYAVTFETIDPLYVLDISDPEDPRISGELEIPGFSNLLQPLGEELLLGIGSDVPAEGPNFIQGVKVALFNVADIEAPVELGSVVIGKRGSSSPAEYNYHALTLLKTDGNYRFTIPVDRHTTVLEGDEANVDLRYWYSWTDSGLFGFEVDAAAGSLIELEPWITETRDEELQWPLFNTHFSRSVIHGDAVFFSQQSIVRAWEWAL